MSLLQKYENFLRESVSIIEILTYTISVIIISISIIYSIFTYINEFKKPQIAFIDTKIVLGESIALALSFILAVEILKIFYIKTYKQLVIVVALTLLKLTISYFLINEIDKTRKMNQI
jgi:uncharacterized membrane protein